MIARLYARVPERLRAGIEWTFVVVVVVAIYLLAFTGGG